MTEEEKKKRGRPAGYRAKNPATETLPKVRVTPDQLASYRDAAEASGQTVSAWVRGALEKEINRARK